MRLSKYSIALGVAAIVVIVAGVAFAAIPDNGGVIHACMLKPTGTIRLIDPSLSSQNLRGHCTSLETEVSWSQQGPKGDPGLQGAAGPKGDPGTVASFDQLAGTPCTLAGKTGTTFITKGDGAFSGPGQQASSNQDPFGMALSCIVPDQFEPNNTIDTATVLDGSWPTSLIVTISPGGDEDWYSIPNAVISVFEIGDWWWQPTYPGTIEVYRDGQLVKTGSYFDPAGRGPGNYLSGSAGAPDNTPHDWLIHVAGTQAHVYQLAFIHF
ncbi:MAG TPA: hypothetical protein VMT59_14915 [Gaiellaceae bacterium]|nr:hypothetical protein [Gaiellaceae bacterium]